jgi:diguanylate cyclase (GGDEF)-like protein
MEATGSWLAPTALDRARVMEASERVRQARTMCAAVMGAALVLSAPWIGWWSLGLLAVTAANFATLDKRLLRSERPERVSAFSMIFTMLVIATGVAFSGGPESPMLPWLVIPGAIAATRFRWQVVCAGAVITAAVTLAVTIPVNPRAVWDDPSVLIATLTLLACVSIITAALMRGEIKHRDQAVLDPLTGLLNRTSLQARGAELEQQARLSGASICVVICDLDHFKQVNDSYGHERGDSVLKDAAYHLRTGLRSFELVYRIGGEEFLVMLPGAGLGEGVELAERLRRGLTASRPGGVDITLSAGVAAGAGEDVRYEELVRRADAALFEAKRSGRNRVTAAEAPGAAAPDARPLVAAAMP